MSQFTNSQETMAKGATRVEAASGDIQRTIGTLRGEVETLLSHWDGDAAGAFGKVHVNFEEQATKINGALRNIHEALLSTHKTYGNQESDQTSSLTGLANTINSSI